MTEPATHPPAPLPEKDKPIVTGAYKTDAQKKAEADKAAHVTPAVKP